MAMSSSLAVSEHNAVFPGTLHAKSFVMPGLVPGIHVFF
jgi:hypothetical protein